jgi:3-dehydroquinate synthase
MAARLSVEMGLLDVGSAERISRLLQSAGLPLTAPAIGVARMEQLMGMDKKVAAGRTRFVILDGLGKARLTDEVPIDCLRKTLIEAGADAS